MLKLFKYRYSILDIAVLLFLFTSPLESIAVLEDFSIVKLSGIVIILAFIFSINKYDFRFDPVSRTHFMLFFYALLSILWSINVENTGNLVFSFLLPTVLITWIICLSVDNEVKLEKIKTAYLLGCIVNCVFALLARESTLAVAEYAGEERLTALGQDQNMLAFLLVMGVVIALSRIKNKSVRVWGKIIYSIISIVLFFVILSTGSRMGLIILLLVLLLFLFSDKKMFFIMTPIVIISGLLILGLLPDSIVDRFWDTESQIRSGDMSQRGEIWKRSLMAFAHENFVLGVGYANFTEMLSESFSGYRVASHNTYLSYLVDLGIIGLIFLLFWIFRLFRYLFYIYRSRKDIFVFAYLLPLVVTMFVLETEYKRWIFILGVLIYRQYVLEKKRNEKIDLY